MVERFTERARQAIVFAQDEARLLRHNYVGTEHVLLGLLRVEDGVSVRVLNGLGVTLENTRAAVRDIVGEGDRTESGQIPFTPRAKKLLESALREARGLGADYIGAEHLTFGLARLNEGVAAVILAKSGVTNRALVEAVSTELGGSPPSGFLESFADESPRATKIVLTERTGVLVSGWVVFAFSVGLGVLIGWAIWGL